MRKLAQYLLVLAFTLPPPHAWAESSASQGANAPAGPSVVGSTSLTEILFGAVPSVSGIERLFVVRNAGVEADFRQMIEQNETLKLQSEMGLSFLKKYQAYMQEDFPGGDFDWMTNPELAAIQFLKMARHDRRAFAERPLTDLEAHSRAWSEVQTRHKSLANQSFRDVENRRNRDIVAHAALRDYQRRVFALQVFKMPVNGRIPPNAETLKAGIRARIEELRRRNFLKTAALAGESHDPTYILSRTSENGKRESFEASFRHYFEGATVRFLPSDIPVDTRIESLKRTDYSEGRNRVQRVFDRINSWLLNRRLKGDLKARRPIYESQVTYPLLPNHTVEITTTTGQSYRLSEYDWEKFLSNLWLPGYDELQDEPRELRRYVTEVIRRDVNLANLAQFVDEHNDATVDGLIRRLEDRRYKAKSLEGDYDTLTDYIRANSSDVFQVHALTGLRWSGFLVHPSYWKFRERTAQNLKKPVLNWSESQRSFVPVAEPPPGTLLGYLHWKEQNREEASAELRTLSKRERQRKVYTRLLRNFLIASVAGTLVYSNIEAVQEAVSYALGGVADTLSGGGVDMVGSSGEERKGRKGSPKRLNSIEPGPTKAGNVDLTGEEGKESPAVFKVEMLNKKLPLPDYVNLFSRTDNNENRVPLVLPKEKVNSDMVITTVKWKADVGLVPIAQVEGYKLVRLDVSVDGDSDPSRYELFEAYGSQLTYLSVKMRSEVSYKAYYQKRRFPHRFSSPALQYMDRNLVMGAGSTLEKIGYKQASASIFKLAADPAPISLGRFAETFSGTGFYTYTPSDFTFNLSQAAVEEYSKFLGPDSAAYYQCSGSNGLWVKLLSEYFDKLYDYGSGLNGRYAVEAFGGYKVGEDGYALVSNGHLRTVVYKMPELLAPINTKEREAAISQVTDATPRNFDPRNPKKQITKAIPFEVPEIPPYNWNQPQYAIRSQRYGYDVARTAGLGLEEMPRLPGPLEVSQSLKPPIDYMQLNSLRFEAERSYVSLAQEDARFGREKDIYQLGLGILPASQVLLRWSVGEITAEQAFYELVAQRSRVPRSAANFKVSIEAEMHVLYVANGNLIPAIGAVIHELAEGTLKSLAGADRLATMDSNRPEAQLGMGGMGTSVYELARYLQGVTWPSADSVPTPACAILLAPVGR